MIVDVPAHQDFYDAGVEYSMMAYSTIVDLFLVLEEYNRDDTDEHDDYWDSARGKLKNAVSLLHQGIDFLLKAKICQVSPFLLIDSTPEKVPKANSTNQISYSDFFTHESSKLPKLYGAYCEPALTERFKQLYEKVRTRRNKIAHTIDTNLTLEAKEILQEAVEIIRYFLTDNWVELRRDYLESNPEFHLHYESWINDQTLLFEFASLKKVLPDSKFIQIYGVSKKSRFYTCSDCTGSAYDPPDTAILTPNTPRSRTVKCLICEEKISVRRRSCQSVGCRSNVISADTNECLLCGEEN